MSRIERLQERNLRIFTQKGSILLSAHLKLALIWLFFLVAIEKMPGWVRAAEIILGLVSLAAGILVIIYPGLGFFTLVAIVAVGLIFLGWRDIVLGAVGKFLPTWLRAADIILGVLAFVLSAVVICLTWSGDFHPGRTSLLCTIRAGSRGNIHGSSR